MNQQPRPTRNATQRAGESRVSAVFADVLRACAVLAVLGAGSLLVAGHVLYPRPSAVRSPVVGPAGHLAMIGFRDTLAVLRRDGLRSGGFDPLEEASSVLLEIRPAALLAGTFSVAAESLTAHVRRLTATPSVMPTQGWLSSHFSRRRFHPLLQVTRPHEGIDVRAPAGTPIEAPAAGTVLHTGWMDGFGRTVVIDHGYGIVTWYAHTARILVVPGQRLQRGEVIATVGRSGLAEAPHLHYEVHVNGRPVDPLKYVLPAVIAD